MTQTEKHALWAQEEQSAEMHGWDFSHIRGRVVEAPLPWDYKQKVLDFLKPQSVILDMGTGGGEFLLSLRHPFSQTSVTESWQPNFELCEKKLAPLGITVRKTEEDKPLPFADNSFDLVLNRHDSYDVNEVRRVLKPGGYLLRVVPMERHLFELKAAVYDRPYENPPAEPAVEGFRLLRTQTLRKTITLSSNEDVQALFLMTPYYYKTGAEDQQKLAAVPSLRVTTEFLIAVCQKP